MASLIGRRYFLSIIKKINCSIYYNNYIYANNFLTSIANKLSTTSDLTINKPNHEVILQLPLSEEDLYKDKDEFIPLSRHTLIRYLIQDRTLMMENSNIFQDFSVCLNVAIDNKYTKHLHDLKKLFEPINPDIDTIITKQFNRREQLDNEFWLLQRLSDVLVKANFKPISDDKIQEAIGCHLSFNGLLVEVDSTKYDVLKFWALGKEEEIKKTSLIKNFFYYFKGKYFISHKFYKRIVVACRLKKSDKLLLKAFKEIKTRNLEQLLPNAKIKMGNYDRYMISLSAIIAGIGTLSQTIAYLVDIDVIWPTIFIFLAIAKATHSVGVYKNRKHQYLLEVSHTLYNKNIANGQGLLTLLVNRAKEEIFKEAILVYAFLLSYKCLPPQHNLNNKVSLPVAGLSNATLEKHIQDWILSKTGKDIDFNSHEAIKLLIDLKIVSTFENRLFCLPLSSAILNLPSRLSAYEIDKNLNEDFDQVIFNEKQEVFLKEENTKKRFWWF